MKRIYIVCLIIIVLFTACSPRKTAPNANSSSSSHSSTQISEPNNLTTPKETQTQVTPTQEIPKQPDSVNQASTQVNTPPKNSPINVKQQKLNQSVTTTSSDSNSNKPIQRDIPLLYPSGNFVQSYNLVISVASIPDPDVSVEELYVVDLTTNEQLFSDPNHRGQSSITDSVPNQITYARHGYSGLERTLKEGHQIQIVIQAWTFGNKYIYKGVHTFTVKNFAVKPLTVVFPSNNSIVSASQANMLKVSAPDMPMLFNTILYDADSKECITRFDDDLREHNLAGIIKPGHNYLVHVTCYGNSGSDPYSTDKAPSSTTESSFSVSN